MLRGIAQQKRVDSGRKLITPKMNDNQLKKFVGSLCSVDTRVIGSSGSITTPIGDWNRHWVDLVHEEDGGDDKIGPRPQCGIDILKEELDALSFKDGVAYARDDVTGTVLLPDLVVQARLEEMTYFKKLGVYKVVPRAHQRQHGGKIIGTRWVDTNKGDSESPNCRSRLVGREFNVGRDDTLYAATPPLEALRVVLSHAATWCSSDVSRRRGVMINDVRRAYFYAKATRYIHRDPV